MPEPRDAIASRLRVARESAGLSQGQVARKLGMHRPTLTEIEAGRRRVTAEELAKLADIYGVDATWITSNRPSDATPDDERILLAARALSRMKDADLERLMTLLRMIRKDKDKE